MPGRASGRAWADRLLLRWCQQSAPGEQTVAAREPLWIDPRLRTELAWLGSALDRLFRRWANGILAGDRRLEDFRPPAFPLAKEIFAGWQPTPESARPVHLRVRFERILVRRAMDPGCPPTNLTCASVQTTRRGQISKPPGDGK